jgi:group I intron endonuclease
LLENLQIAKKSLDGLSGIYGVVNTPTGTSYIGSSSDLGLRIMNHIQGHSSNLHLQGAILKYGLSSFVFVILQYCNSSDLLKLEQYFLDILFSLSANFRYNFNPTADSRFGATHTPESKAQMSDSQQLVDRSGANNPMYGKVPASAFKSGANHTMYGKVPNHAMTVNVYSLENKLVRSFPSQVAAAEWLGVSNFTVHNYINSGKVWKQTYTFRKSS